VQMRILSVVILTATLSIQATAEPARWPTWRGTDGSRVVTEGNPPLQWSESDNIKWKTDLPGDGQSTPIIWDDRIFLQTAEAVGDVDDKLPTYRLSLLCLDRASGEILWQTQVQEERPHEGHHKTGSMAPFSPVTDGERIWASFGSRGLFCLSVDGELLWKSKAVEMNKFGKFGEGSSPVVVGGVVIVLSDHEGQSKISAFDKDSGKLVWQQDREEGSSWNTPTPAKVGDRTEIITTSTGSIRSYDAATGEPIWNCGGLTSCAAPSPVVRDGLVYCTTGYKGEALMAVELGHTGDLTGSDSVRWFVDKTGASVPTPLVHEGRIYVIKGYSNVLSCYDAATGAPIYERQRIKGLKTIYASPIAVGKNIYFCDRSGATVVIKASDAFEIVATNNLDEVLDGSPVVIGDELYLRGRSRIYCVADS
jgi:outer membrane protein assembly factor BamB